MVLNLFQLMEKLSERNLFLSQGLTIHIQVCTLYNHNFVCKLQGKPASRNITCIATLDPLGRKAVEIL